MPRDLRTARHYALRQFGGCSCSLGLGECTCFTACEKPETDDEWEPVPDAEVIWLLMPFIVGVIGGLAILVMVLT